jgi:hypothetical protein
MKINNHLQIFVICSVIALAVGCGKKAQTPGPGSNPAASSNPETQAVAAVPNAQVTLAEIDTMKFQRITVRANSLIQQKQYQQAAETLQQLDNLKLTPVQKSTLDSLKAKIPK